MIPGQLKIEEEFEDFPRLPQKFKNTSHCVVIIVKDTCHCVNIVKGTCHYVVFFNEPW